MNENFIIPLNGLAAGRNEFEWKVGKTFFESFDNSEILDADIDVAVAVEKSGRHVGVDCDLSGAVTVECDRCLDELKISVDTGIRLSVEYGGEDAVPDSAENGREVVFVSEDEAVLDMSQIIYDYVCLALPMQRVHDEGECSPEVMKYLSGNVGKTESGNDNPFSALKGLF